MVFLNSRLFQVIKRKGKAFLDSIYINVKGGIGGNGLPKYGGIGGKGGDIYVEAQLNETLKNIVKNNPNRRFAAGSGENSRSYRILGKPGTDVVIPVPVGITVIGDRNKILGELNKPGDQILVARGGKGGSPDNQYFGQKGLSQNVTLDLKLIADVGFIGFPNAGKSTLLKALSRASPKIANYPFTTIKPQVGVMIYKDGRQITLADLPGLIEGAHVNFGMGHKFLKHVIRTKMLLFVVDIGGFQLNFQSSIRNAFETIMLLNKELELYKEELLDKPALLVINKMDSENSEKTFATLIEDLKFAKENTKEIPEEIRPVNLVTFDDIIPIIANKGHNIEKLKDRIRTLLDFYYNLEIAEKQKSLQVFNYGKREETKSLQLM